MVGKANNSSHSGGEREDRAEKKMGRGLIFIFFLRLCDLGVKTGLVVLFFRPHIRTP